MKQSKITIEDSGRITVPAKVSMRPFEIAQLFDVYVQTVNANIKAILKSAIVRADISGTVTASGGCIIPDTFGLEMITALAFRIDTYKTKTFRRWILRRMTANTDTPSLFISLSKNAMPN